MHFAEIKSVDNLTKERLYWNYGIILRPPSLSGYDVLVIGKNEDNTLHLYRDDLRLRINGSGNGVAFVDMKHVRFLRIRFVARHKIPRTIILDETVESRRFLVSSLRLRTSYYHVSFPGQYARNARGEIVSARPSFLRRLLRKAGLPIAIGIGLYSLLFANDAEAQIHESQTSEDVRIEMTPEEFEQANEEIDLALDSYYSMLVINERANTI